MDDKKMMTVRKMGSEDLLGADDLIKLYMVAKRRLLNCNMAQN